LKRGDTPKFVEDNGAAPGSCVIMTDNAFMTTEVWEEMTPFFMEGYCKVNGHVEANLQWYMTEILDGFGAHHN